MKRRDFVKVAGGGLTAIALGAFNLPPVFKQQQVLASHEPIKLIITEVMHEMINFELVYSWAFADVNGPNIPGPVIFVEAGHNVDISITNTLDEAHAFFIPGVVDSGPIKPNRNVTVRFQAPAPGTYVYEDNLRRPVNRVLGLHGVMVVLPPAGTSNTPYSSPPPAIQTLFDDLGTADHFPGEPWIPIRPPGVEPNPKFDPENPFLWRTRLWVFSQVDPTWNAQAQNNANIDPDTFRRNFIPYYWTFNGLSGYFAAHNHDIELAAHVGEPILIRNVHVGVGVDDPHIHANHGYLLAVNGQVQSNVLWVDTWTSSPWDLQNWALAEPGRYDVLYPMIKPPDIPEDTWIKLLTGVSEEGYPFLTGASGGSFSGPNAPGDESPNPMYTFDTRPRLVPNPEFEGGQEPKFEMFYPMHSHMEQSQTAAGGNYPQGTVTHIHFHGINPLAYAFYKDKLGL